MVSRPFAWQAIPASFSLANESSSHQPILWKGNWSTSALLLPSAGPKSGTISVQLVDSSKKNKTILFCWLNEILLSVYLGKYFTLNLSDISLFSMQEILSCSAQGQIPWSWQILQIPRPKKGWNAGRGKETSQSTTLTEDFHVSCQLWKPLNTSYGSQKAKPFPPKKPIIGWNSDASKRRRDNQWKWPSQQTA